MIFNDTYLVTFYRKLVRPPDQLTQGLFMPSTSHLFIACKNGDELFYASKKTEMTGKN